MKITPEHSMVPRLMASDTMATSTEGYTIKLETVADPKMRQSYLAFCLASRSKTTCVWLTPIEALSLSRKIQELVTVL